MTLPSVPAPLLGATQPMYLGAPGNLQRLRMPDNGYQSVASRAETVHQLISGGVAVTKLPKTKRAWSLPFTGMSEDTANTLVAFYAGAFGRGPFVIVDPAWRNKLGTESSSMGAVLQAISGWSTAITGTQTLAWDGTDAAAFPQSDVMTWTGATSASKMGLGTWVAGVLTPRTVEAPVYLFDQPAAASIYVQTASSTASVSLVANAVTAAGAISLAGTTATATVSSSGWTRLTSYLAAGNATAQYIVLQITCNTGSAPVIWMSAADLQYGPTAANGQLAAWVLGLGSPRVVVVPASGGGFTSTSRLLPYRDQTLTLAEI